MKNLAILLTDKYTSHPRSTLNFESCIEDKTANIHSCVLMHSENVKSMSRYLRSKYGELLGLYGDFDGKKIVYIFMGYSESLTNFSNQEFIAHYSSILKVLNKIGFEICICTPHFLGRESTVQQDAFGAFLNEELEHGFLKGYKELSLKLKPSKDKSLTKMSVIVNSKIIAKHFDSGYVPEVIIKVYKTLDEHNLPTGRPLKKAKKSSIVNIDAGVFG